LSPPIFFIVCILCRNVLIDKFPRDGSRGGQTSPGAGRHVCASRNVSRCLVFVC
jgi:hypothetical protein